MPLNFKHINADEQILDGTIGTALLEDGSVTAAKLAPNAAVLTIQADVNPPLTGAVELASGVGISLHQVGQVITINAGSSPTQGDLTDTGTDGIVITNGTGAVNGTGTQIAQHVADATHNGYLSLTDWTIFNNKQNVGVDLPLAGGTMSGDIDMGGNGIAHLATPVNPQDAATKNYVDTHSGGPAGSNTEIQFNNSGSFGGSSNFVWTGTALSIIGNIVSDGVAGIGTLLPDSSAQLDITSTTRGFLPPRMNTTEKNAIVNPATGLIVYDTTLDVLQVYNGSVWVSSGGSAATYAQDVFNVSGPGNVFPLSHVPALNSQVVYYNGDALSPGISNDYTISGNTVTLNVGITLTNGDRILVVYSY